MKECARGAPSIQQTDMNSGNTEPDEKPTPPANLIGRTAERLFKLSEHRTDIRTEVAAGVTTFLTMAYIIFVNPAILAEAKMPFGAVFAATCVAAAIGCFLMAFLAKMM